VSQSPIILSDIVDVDSTNTNTLDDIKYGLGAYSTKVNLHTAAYLLTAHSPSASSVCVAVANIRDLRRVRVRGAPAFLVI
jgi:hypothetical protein